MLSVSFLGINFKTATVATTATKASNRTPEITRTLRTDDLVLNEIMKVTSNPNPVNLTNSHMFMILFQIRVIILIDAIQSWYIIYILPAMCHRLIQLRICYLLFIMNHWIVIHDFVQMIRNSQIKSM